MNDDMPVYGTTQLTPAVIRSARFPASPGGAPGYDPAAIHEFLEQVASAVEVLGSSDAAAAIRRELERSSEISARMVLVGHETAERLRQQAAADAQAIIEDAKRLTEQLREAARQETERTRAHVDELRGTFIEELRDMYDRIGATLYRFETASRTAAATTPGIAEPAVKAPAEQPASPGTSATEIVGENPDSFGWTTPEPAEPAGAWLVDDAPAEPTGGSWLDAEDTAASGASGGSWLDAGTEAEEEAEATPEEVAPAWTQLPDELRGPAPSITDLAAGHDSTSADAPESDAEADITLAPGEPLVDLSAMQQVEEAPAPIEEPQAPALTDDDRAEAMIAGLDEVLSTTGEHDAAEAEAASTFVDPEPLPDPWAAPPAEEFEATPPAETEYAAPAEAEYAAPPEPAADAFSAPVFEPEPEAAPDAVAEAPPAAPTEPELAFPQTEEAPAATPFGDVETFATAHEPEAAPAEAAPASQQPDPAAVRQFVLQSIHEGQPREAVEAYLRESLGFTDPVTFVDEALRSGQ